MKPIVVDAIPSLSARVVGLSYNLEREIRQLLVVTFSLNLEIKFSISEDGCCYFDRVEVG